MPLQLGTTLGPYEIQAPSGLGAWAKCVPLRVARLG